jgi:hypothetical protein
MMNLWPMTQQKYNLIMNFRPRGFVFSAGQIQVSIGLLMGENPNSGEKSLSAKDRLLSIIGSRQRAIESLTNKRIPSPCRLYQDRRTGRLYRYGRHSG